MQIKAERRNREEHAERVLLLEKQLATSNMDWEVEESARLQELAGLKVSQP